MSTQTADALYSRMNLEDMDRKRAVDALMRKYKDVPVHDIIGRVPKADAVADFNKLRTAPARKLSLSRQGSLAVRHIMAKEIFKCTKGTKYNQVSLYEAWKSDIRRRSIMTALVRMYGKRTVRSVTHATVLHAYRLHYGYISSFSPMVAKYLYQRYAHIGGSDVLDFSSGWGGRLLGALSCDKVNSYTGIDSNSALAPRYAQMIKTFNTEGKPVHMISAAAETIDYSKVPKFDLVLTSPPYYGIETYQNSPTYTSHEDWLQRFFAVVLTGIVEHISPGGSVIINIRQPETEKWMVDHMKTLRWKCAMKLKMPLAARLPGITPTSMNKSEPIYVFRGM